MNRHLAVFALAFFVFLGIAAGSAPWAAGPAKEASNWPQWRGPASSGVSLERDLPTEWSETKNVTWKTPIPGRGHSSPVIWGNRIFLTTSIEGPVVPGAQAPVHMINGKQFLHPDSVGADHSYTLRVMSLDRDTGEVLWKKTAYEGPVYDDRHRRNTYASPTPVTDGRYVYVSFGPAGLFAFDFDGKQVWEASLGEVATLGMGVGTSPILHEELVIVQCDIELGEDSYIAAFNKETGEEVWRVARKVQVSWSTPIIVQTAKRAELLVNGNEYVIAYDPGTGRELWRSEGVQSHAIPTPVAGHNMVYFSAGFPAKRVIAVRLGGNDSPDDSENVAWTYNKGTAYVPSPVLYGDYLYLISDAGILTCLEAKTGNVIYDNGRVPIPAKFMASLVAFDGKLLLSSTDGEMFVVQAGPEHKVLQTNSMEEPIWATPAISGGKIFVRGARHLFAIGSGE